MRNEWSKFETLSKTRQIVWNLIRLDRSHTICCGRIFFGGGSMFSAIFYLFVPIHPFSHTNLFQQSIISIWWLWCSAFLVKLKAFLFLYLIFNFFTEGKLFCFVIQLHTIFWIRMIKSTARIRGPVYLSILFIFTICFESIELNLYFPCKSAKYT